jgi:hypothetical protein
MKLSMRLSNDTEIIEIILTLLQWRNVIISTEDSVVKKFPKKYAERFYNKRSDR